MFNRFMNKDNVKNYSMVKNANNRISAQFKKIKIMLHEMNYSIDIVEKYLFIINAALNIKRKIKLKGTAY